MQGNQAAYAALVADVPGVITAVEGEPGMVVAAGSWVVRLAHDGPRDVVFAVPEDKVELLRHAAGTRAGWRCACGAAATRCLRRCARCRRPPTP